MTDDDIRIQNLFEIAKMQNDTIKNLSNALSIMNERVELLEKHIINIIGKN